MLDPEFRKPYVNVNRYFVTCVNQPEFKEVFGDVTLCSVAAQFDGWLSSIGMVGSHASTHTHTHTHTHTTQQRSTISCSPKRRRKRKRRRRLRQLLLSQLARSPSKRRKRRRRRRRRIVHQSLLNSQTLTPACLQGICLFFPGVCCL